MRFAFMALGMLATAACNGDDAPAADAAPVFIDAPTMCPAQPPPPEDCDFFLGCGCDTPAEKCSVAPDGRACFAAGMLEEGALCFAESECAAGLACLVYEGDRRCLRFCDEVHPCPGQASGSQACFVRVVDDGVPPTELGKVCGPQCGLLDQDCPFETQGCYESAAVTTAERGVCLTAGAKIQGETCAAATDCAEGYLCVNRDGSGVLECARLCDRGDGTPGCDDGGACLPLPDHTRTGVCLIP